jgi:hypothetical protein
MKILDFERGDRFFWLFSFELEMIIKKIGNDRFYSRNEFFQAINFVTLVFRSKKWGGK